MSLELTSEFWSREISAASDMNERHLRAYDAQIAKYHTPFFQGVGDAGQYDPENHAYEYITGLVPQMVYRNPRIRAESSKAGLGGWIATMYKHILNKRVQEIQLEETLIELAHDAIFQRAIAIVVPRIDYRYPVGSTYAYNPEIVRISPKDYLIDSLAARRKDARWTGHSWIEDRDVLLERADTEDGWDKSAIRGLPVDRDRQAGSLKRDEVRCVDIYIPGMVVDEDASQDDGFYGAQLTFAWSEKGVGDIIRRPTPILSHPTGRYRVCDVSYVPDSPYGLSPLVATEGQSRELNRLTRRAIAMSMRYARLLLVEDGDAGFAQRLKEAENDLVMSVRSLEGNRVQSVERGGITEQIMGQIEAARQRLDRNASTSDSWRGMVSKNVTATAETLADAASDIRTDFIKTRFHSFARQLVEDMAFFYWHDDRTRSFLGGDFLAEMGVPREQIEQAGIPGFEYEGGDGKFPAYRGVSFSDLGVAFEPLSMERTTEATAQRRTLQAMGMVTQVAQLAAMMPQHDWSALANLIGDALNIPDFAKIAGVQNPGQLQMPGMGAPGLPAQGMPSMGGEMPGNNMAGELAAGARRIG